MNGGWKPYDDYEKYRLRLSGIEYGIPGRPAIGIHSNQGITFDLDAIRKSTPGFWVTRFSGVFGLSESINLGRNYAEGAKQVKGEEAKVDIWVLVDGEIRFSKMDVCKQDGGLPISVDLNEQDHFLTLVVTEGSDHRIDYDWALIAEPLLELKLSKH